MKKILVSLPDRLAQRMKVMIPHGNRSKIVAELLDKEIAKREESLYECARAVQADRALTSEMTEWNSTVCDGIDSQSPHG